MIHTTNTHQTTNPLFPRFFVVIASLFSPSLAKTTNTQTPHNVVVGSKCEDTVCFEVQECGPQACVDAKRAGKKGWWKVCTQTRQWLCHSSMTVWWLVALLAWWWLQCVVEWMWNATECGDAHKRLIAPRWFERKKEAQCLVNHIHQSKPTPTHQLVLFVRPLPQLVCALCGCVFVVCDTRGLAQSKHQALVMTIASSKPINLNPHHVHVFVLCSCNNSAWSLVQHGCLLNAIADAGVWLFTLVFKPNTTLTATWCVQSTQMKAS